MTASEYRVRGKPHTERERERERERQRVEETMFNAGERIPIQNNEGSLSIVTICPSPACGAKICILDTPGQRN